MLERPVVDKTSLHGTYDLKMTWTPDETALSPADGNEKPGAPEPSLTLVTALKDQLGLRLRSQKMPVQMLVVDHVEKLPSEN